MKTTIAAKYAVARKQHICCVCDSKIAIGRKYELGFCIEEAEPIRTRTCMVCVNNRTAIHCGDDMGWNDELRRQTKAAADKWEAGQ